MSDQARTNILQRLRASATAVPSHLHPTENTEADWLAQQPPVGDLADRFQAEAEKLQSKVIRVPNWEALPQAVAPWFREYKINSLITGEVPKLEPLREYLAKETGAELHRYDRTVEEQKETLFSVDCGITTAHGAIADTGTIVLVPKEAEPRLLSLAPQVHLVVVEKSQLFANITELLAADNYVNERPSNMVFISGASRTADIELTLVMGAHGPRVFLIALVG